jgi:Peptidase A4 family
MHHLPRILTCALVTALTALGVVAGAGVAANASPAHATASPAQARGRPALPAATAAALAVIKELKVGGHATDQRMPGFTRVKGLSQVQSSNWSGYADTGSSFSQVAGSWSEPGVTCSGRSTTYAAFWVGIDGYSSDSVEQDGTLIECYRGTAYQYSWWEMYPTNDIQVVGESVAAHDTISASVVRSGDSYTLKVTDSTHSANSFTTTQTCSDCANSSAEWIAEAPCCTNSGGILPLADFGTWTESGATVTEGSTSGVISSFTDDEITMVDNSDLVKAQPGSLNSSGNGFSVTWERSS